MRQSGIMSFLRRFRDPPLPSRTPEAGRIESITANLSRILGSQRDYSSFLTDFGLGQTWHRPVTPRTLELLRQEILAQVSTYEERLRDPEVETLPRPADGTLRFRLIGALPDGARISLLIQLSPSQPVSASIERREQG